MKIYAGTSGYSYKQWKGSFYPEKIPAGEMLAYYSGRLDSVEINNTFYRMPGESLVEAWGEQVRRGFLFAIKAPQLITHIKGLRNVGEDTKTFLDAVSVLEDKLGALLFQFPASFREDRGLLKDFLGLLPSKTPCAFEFRNASWLNQGTYDLLAEKEFSLCTADTDENPAKEIVGTAPWGYLRLRRADYTGADLSRWAKNIRARKWKKAFVFFKHDEDGTPKGPEFALRFRALTGKRVKAGVF